MGQPDGAPDFGPHAPPPAGAVAIGARPLLIAFNINLNTTDRRVAARLAARLRESGGRQGPGLLKAVKAIGWRIEQYRRCQISTNLVDYTVTPPHVVMEAARRLAAEQGVLVTGAELVGLMPLEAARLAGQHYLTRQGRNPGVSDDVLVEVAAQSLGLRDVRPFSAEEHILERRLAQDGALVRGSVRALADALASSRSAPGGGATAAMCGAMAAALAAMVALLSSGREDHDLSDEELSAAATEAQRLKEAFLADVDGDARAWSAAEASRFSEETVSQAIEVPLGVVERAQQTLTLVELVIRGAPRCRADAYAAASAAAACARAGWHSVLANLDMVEDDVERSASRLRADTALRDVERRAAALRDPRMPDPDPPAGD